jgi:23S rRNA (uracil1939-C5)-methyltransferase
MSRPKLPKSSRPPAQPKTLGAPGLVRRGGETGEEKKLASPSSRVLPGASVRSDEPLPIAQNVVEIEKPVYGGAFLAHAEGKAIFVPLTLPGEPVRIRIKQNKSGYSTAELTEVLTPSPERIHARCPHFGACGGCHYQHTAYENQLAFKHAILRETLERAGVEPAQEISILSANPWSYRNRIRLAFDAEGRPGYRSRRSHAVIPIRECPIAAPLLVSAAQAATDALERVPLNLRPTEMSLFCDPAESALLATFFAAESSAVRLESLAKALHERIPALRGAELAADGRPGHPARTLAKWGANSISYPAAGFNYRVDHGAFFQVNRWLVDALVAQVTEGQAGELAWDLFAGVGLFARKLTARFTRVIAVESAPPAVNALEENLKGTTGAAVRASTLDFLRNAITGQRPNLIAPDLIVPDLIVLDPPRTGLGADVTVLLAQIAAPRLVYVSCDPATLARDLRALLATGYAIHSITLADLFPQTFHLEAVVHLHRS